MLGSQPVILLRDDRPFSTAGPRDMSLKRLWITDLLLSLFTSPLSRGQYHVCTTMYQHGELCWWCMAEEPCDHRPPDPRAEQPPFQFKWKISLYLVTPRESCLARRIQASVVCERHTVGRKNQEGILRSVHFSIKVQLLIFFYTE